MAVLVDSKSASASEITARVLQLEKRATIYGDFSSGSVMTSIRVPFVSFVSKLVNEALIRVSMTVTVSDVIMSDGSRLEKTGVVPDDIIVPTGLALKHRFDPVLAYAAAKMGASITEEEAGKFHFVAQKTEDEEEDSHSDKEQ
jgi:C-terminal processing protease CtpA/Prc